MAEIRNADRSMRIDLDEIGSRASVAVAGLAIEGDRNLAPSSLEAGPGPAASGSLCIMCR